MPSPKLERMVVMGRVVAPFGIKGWIKIQPFTNAAGNLSAYPEWWVGRDEDFRMKRVVESAPHGRGMIARLEQCEDREAAALLAGQEIAVPHARLPAIDSGAYYWDDLIGCDVTNTKGELLGAVVKILDTGANSVLVIKGECEHLLPFVENVILDVDLELQRISVDWGLDF